MPDSGIGLSAAITREDYPLSMSASHIVALLGVAIVAGPAIYAVLWFDDWERRNAPPRRRDPGYGDSWTGSEHHTDCGSDGGGDGGDGD